MTSRHVPVEEGQQQGPDVGAVDVGVGHDDDPVVAQLREVEALADARPEGDDQRPDVLAREDLVEARLLDVEQLAAQRQDRLEASVAALLGRAAGRVALDDVELAPGRDRVPGSRPACPGRDRPSSAPLRMTRSRALRAASRARAAVRHFSMIRRPSAGFSSRYWPRLSATAVWTWPLTSALPSLALVWPSNCGSVSLTLMTAVRPSRTSSPERLPSVLEDAGATCPVVERARQRRPEAGDVGAAVDGVDVVGEREHVLGVRVVVLERDLDGGAPLPALDVDRPVVEGLLVPVQVPDEGLEPALEVERALAIDPLVDERDPDALREVGRLAEALADRLERVVDRLEHRLVGA